MTDTFWKLCREADKRMAAQLAAQRRRGNRLTIFGNRDTIFQRF
jgi:hypothetical protein